MNSWTLSLYYPVYADGATILTSDQLQVDMCPPINAFAALLGLNKKVIVAQDKTPKHGCR